MNTELKIPDVIRENAEGSDVYRIIDLMFQDRIIFLTGSITQQTASAVILQLLYLDRRSHDEITICFASPGGDIYAGLGIYDVMNAIQSPIRSVFEEDEEADPCFDEEGYVVFC